MDQKLGKESKKVNKDFTFTSGKNFRGILCQKKLKQLPNNHPGMYQLDCLGNGRYIGESKKKVLTHCTEYQQDSIKGNWESPHVTEHTKKCHGKFNWIYLKTIIVLLNMYKRKVHEAFEINRLKTLNETDKTFKSTKQRERERVVTTTSPQTVANTFPENRKPLNCNFGVRFYVNLKTTFSKLS